jgi:hypothetical protein
MRSKAEVGESKQGSASRSGLIFLVGTPGDDLERVIGQWPLECPRLIPRRAHPDGTLLVRRQDHRHGFRMDRVDHRVRRCCQEAVDKMRLAGQPSPLGDFSRPSVLMIIIDAAPHVSVAN